MTGSRGSLGAIALAVVGMAVLPAVAQQPKPPAKQKPAPAPARGGVAGTWVGAVTQPGSKPYSIVMTLQAGGGETDYPDLQCGGKLTRAGAASGYTFFIETITRGRLDKGGPLHRRQRYRDDGGHAACVGLGRGPQRPDAGRPRQFEAPLV